MSEELRYDQGQIELTTEDGFLRAKVFLTRPGVYPYLLSNGEISYEAKLEEDLFSDVVLDTAKGAPVVEDHPLGKIVTATNFKELVKGTISNPRREGKFLVADEVIYDSDLISKLKQGVKREVSVGWKCDLVSQSGEINGRRYDKVQKNLAVNHIAHVSKGNAGPEAKIQLDSGLSFGVMKLDETIFDETKGELMPENPTATPDAESGLLQKIYDMLVSAFKTEKPAEVTPSPQASPSVENSAVKIASMQAELAIYKNKVAELEAKLGEFNSVKMDSAIQERVELLEQAKTVIPELKIDSKLSNLDIKKAIVEKLSPNIRNLARREIFIQF